ncbi:N-acetylmuramoyl-L-alanine amidase [Gillisia sp. M10.2A]|uniref:N-acetylmuramoyl-L-alanine amidase n=1 Tax=Gillisia lutea TaxID=2909668 RepID=A0ABS9EFG1_9FLAO|nr:N-acetylmuramoyl-L-alanine amidase [Gillisia lutea]MCF4100604.1 N-acetylmuramoyl-L-alanine amidase [Gillisia lutea]
MKHLPSLVAILLLIALIASCSSNPYSKTNRVYKKQAKEYGKQLSKFPIEHSEKEATLNFGEYEVGTTNFNLRKPNYVVIHHTAQDSVAQTLKTFTLVRTQVSSHYVIGDNGEIYQMLNDYYRAWHGGSGQWGNNTDLNSSSIGIELDNNGSEVFSEAQIQSLMQLLKVLKEKYNIPAANFIGHSDIAPTRKVDPNRNFPWKQLAEEGYGLWYDDIPFVSVEDTLVTEKEIVKEVPILEEPTVENDSIFEVKEQKVVSPLDVSPEIALKIIGYDTSNMDAAIRAFKLHFIQTEVNANLTDSDLKILNNLYKKYLK